MEPMTSHEFGGDPFPMRVPLLKSPAEGPGKSSDREVDAEADDDKVYDLGGSD